MRFDYRGSGDSFGELEDTTLADWLEDIALVEREGREISDGRVVHLLGVRAGALLACRSAAVASTIKRVVLWDPIVDGSGYVETLRQAQVELCDLHPHLGRAQRREAMREYAGYTLSDRMVGELSSLDARVYSSLPAGMLHVVSTLPENSFPVHAIPYENVAFQCDWDIVSNEPLMPRPVIERLVACLHVPDRRTCSFRRRRTTVGYPHLPDLVATRSATIAVVCFLQRRVAAPGWSESLVRPSCTTARAERIRLAANRPGGKGREPCTPGLTSNASVAADYDEILRSLDARLGRVQLVLGGLCAGADDAIRLAPIDSRVIGLLLLDPICFPDEGFATRATIMTYTRATTYSTWIKRRLRGRTRRPAANASKVDPLIYRNSPTLEELRAAFAALGERHGRALSVFSEYALRYYNQPGQLARVANVEGAVGLCTEVLWPETEHVYALDIHRRRLMELVRTWAAGFSPPAQVRIGGVGYTSPQPFGAKV